MSLANDILEAVKLVERNGTELLRSEESVFYGLINKAAGLEATLEATEAELERVKANCQQVSDELRKYQLGLHPDMLKSYAAGRRQGWDDAQP